MKARLHRLLIVLCSVLSTALAVPSAGNSYDQLAEPLCPAGTNWDNGTQSCR